jgi:hypothetical protein
MGRIRTFVAGSITGATAAYLLDPDRGRGRRAVLRDRSVAMVRRGGRRADRLGRATRAEIGGKVEALRHRRPEDLHPDDLTLRDRVESEVFAGDRFPKGQINLSVVDSVVELRGELSTAKDIQAFEDAVRAVPGVADVNSMLHLPNTPAPNKREAREVR